MDQFVLLESKSGLMQCRPHEAQDHLIPVSESQVGRSGRSDGLLAIPEGYDG